jgi:hypothetical protein
MYQSAPWGTRIFFNPQREDVQAISKLLSLFWTFEMYGRDLYTLLSLLYQIRSM